MLTSLDFCAQYKNCPVTLLHQSFSDYWLSVSVWLRPIHNWLLLLQIWLQGSVRRVFGRIISEYRKVYCNGFFKQLFITKSVKLLRKLERQRFSNNAVSWFIIESGDFCHSSLSWNLTTPLASTNP